MKRGGRLNRYTELRNQAPLQRGDSELKRTEFPKRATPLRSTPSPKLSGTNLSRAARSPKQRKPLPTSRPRVSREEVEARRTVRRRSNGVCEVCDAARATNFQHRLPQSAQGPWDAANGLDVCGAGNYSGCHSRIHLNSTEAYVRGWAVKRGQDFRTVPVDHALHGCVLLHSDGTWTPTTREAA